MKWDIDKALTALHDPSWTIQGTIIQRISMDKCLLKSNGMDPSKCTRERAFVWCLGLGLMLEGKHFFYGYTIRQAYLKALKTLKWLNKSDRALAARLHGIKVPKKRNTFPRKKGPTKKTDSTE